jgi:hypothetical protein
MNQKVFVDKVLNQFAIRITDHVFLMIQNDKKLMQRYLNIIARGTKPHTLNCKLGKQIKNKFNLKNTGRCKQPQSTLIRSYERHKIK